MYLLNDVQIMSQIHRQSTVLIRFSSAWVHFLKSLSTLSSPERSSIFSRWCCSALSRRASCSVRFSSAYSFSHERHSFLFRLPDPSRGFLGVFWGVELLPAASEWHFLIAGLLSSLFSWSDFSGVSGCLVESPCPELLVMVYGLTFGW